MSSQPARVLILAFAICGSAAALPATEPPLAVLDQSVEAKSSTQLESVRRFLGVGSCAASNCHGGGSGIAGSEASIWIQQDPHAEAYSVLFNPVSMRIAALLKLDRPAHQATLCLNCHAPQSEDLSNAPLAPHSVLTDGVNCEACHGAASDWLGPHVRYDWKSRSANDKAALGFRNTRDLWTRSQLCADCHVGSPGRDVNHDLYAAGHPRLFFEMSAFNANMPAHWDRNRDKHPEGTSSPSSSFEAKLWAVGTLASAEAALDLLIHRAETARDSQAVLTSDGTYPAQTTVTVWPEFAETGCFACHHDLQAPSWRLLRDAPGRRPGAAPWGTWLFPLAPAVTGLSEKQDSIVASGNLAELTRLMGSPYPDRVKVVAAATALQLEMATAGQRLNSADWTSEDLAGLLRQLAGQGRDLSRQNWDAATQTYLGLVAVHQGYRDASGQAAGVLTPESRRIHGALEQIREQLEFQSGFNSPKTFGEHPAERIESELEQIENALKPVSE